MKPMNCQYWESFGQLESALAAVYGCQTADITFVDAMDSLNSGHLYLFGTELGTVMWEGTTILYYPL